MRRSLVGLFTLLAAVSSCTEKRGDSAKIDPSLKPKIILAAAPAPAHSSQFQFGDKMRLLGYDLSTENVAPDKPFTVTWYWQVLEPLDKGYKIFTHLSDGKINRINLDATRNLRRGYPEAEWKKGDLLKDEQVVKLPPDWDSSEAVFYLGFYSGETRLPVKNGKDDGERRAEALRLKLLPANAAKAPEPAVPRLIARKLTGPIKLDGVLDEADWGAAQRTGPFVNTMNGTPGTFEARAQVLYDAEAFYAAFTVSDDYLKTRFKADDEHLWEEDTTEIMFDPDGDGKNYFELQVSPRGVHFDTRYDAARDPRPFGHVDWSSQVKAGVKVQGTIDDKDSDNPDVGYTVELRVPWTAFAVGEPPAARPAKADTWRINFFVMDSREKGQRAVGWSAPMVGDFHTLAKFGRVVFPEDLGAAAAPAKAEPVKAAPAKPAPTKAKTAPKP
jgi:hypothetical protein